MKLLRVVLPVLLALPAAISVAVSPAAALGHRQIVGDLPALFTTWDISHEKEDGTEDDICIMEARGPMIPGLFAIRRDLTRSYYKQRVLDPKASFAYGVPQQVLTAFDADPDHKGWQSYASGTAAVFDVNIPTGPLFARYEDQMLNASSVSMVVGSDVWTAPLRNTRQAYALLQDCVVSVSIGDGRW